MDKKKIKRVFLCPNIIAKLFCKHSLIASSDDYIIKWTEINYKFIGISKDKLMIVTNVDNILSILAKMIHLGTSNIGFLFLIVMNKIIFDKMIHLKI